MSTQKHTPELVEAALGYVKNLQCPADKLSAFLEYRRSHESLALEDCVEKILRSHIAALTEENARLSSEIYNKVEAQTSEHFSTLHQSVPQILPAIKALKSQLAAFEGADEVPPEATYTASHTVEEQVFFAIHRWYPKGTRVYIVRPKPSKQEETP